MPDLDADREVEQLAQARPNAIAKLSYTHKDMVDFIIAHPGVDQRTIGARYGFTGAWVSRMLSSDAFQEQMAKRRAELVDPAILATIDERFKALAIRSIDVLMTKLESPGVEANVALRAAELGAKAMGLGGHAPPPKPPDPEGDVLDRLARRLVTLNQPRPLEGEFTKETADASADEQ